MVDLDTIDLEAIERRTLAPTAELLTELFPFDPLPRTDPAGVRRIGFGRPFEKRAMPVDVAERHLAHDITEAQSVVRGRVFELIARQPMAEQRLKYVYAIADVIGPQEMKGWSKFWQCLSSGDWEGAAAELMLAKWDQLVGRDDKTRRAVWQLVNRLQLGPAS